MTGAHTDVTEGFIYGSFMGPVLIVSITSQVESISLDQHTNIVSLHVEDTDIAN